MVRGGSAALADGNRHWPRLGPDLAVTLISSTLAQRLTIEELEAVCLHEAAHLKLGHLPARTGVAFLGGALTIVALAGVVMLLPRAVHRWAIPVSVAGVFLLRQLVLAWQSRRQEDEADEAVKRAFMGTLLASALGKLHGDSATNAEVPLAVWEGHRSIEDRIENLSAREARL